MVTTTHDPLGGGRPRLIFAYGGSTQTHDEVREFHLFPGVTRIGSAADADLSLDGLDEQQAEVRRDEADEYYFVHVGSASTPSTVDGAPMGTTVLRTGNRIEMGRWTMSFFREEFADHGRPYGGREGGNNSYQRPQDEPRARTGAGDGGELQTDAEPGQYF